MWIKKKKNSDHVKQTNRSLPLFLGTLQFGIIFYIKLFHNQQIVATICFNRKKLLESCFLSSNWIDLSGVLLIWLLIVQQSSNFSSAHINRHFYLTIDSQDQISDTGIFLDMQNLLRNLFFLQQRQNGLVACITIDLQTNLKPQQTKEITIFYSFSS